MKMRREHLFITGYLLVLTALATMGYLVGDYTVRSQLQHEAAARKNFTTDVGFVDLPRMNMTLSSTRGQSGQLRIDISLKVEQKDLDRLEDFQPIITDRLISYIRKLDMNDMRKPNAAPILRKNLLQQVNRATYPVPVLDIIFQQFVIM